MSENKFKFPTEVVELPSKGLPYPESSPLSSGKIEMKYMSAREEDILTNMNFIRQGVVIDKLLQSMIVSEIDYSELLIGDKNALLVASRILGYGKDYEFEITDDFGQKIKTTVDLNDFNPNENKMEKIQKKLEILKTIVEELKKYNLLID